MVNQPKLDEVRKIILSCLLSRKGPTSIPLLERDYLEADERRIPYRQFGYANVVEFLRSMPEHFIVEEYNGGHTVRGIASEKSKHVSSLVERQKTGDQRSRYIPPHLRGEPYNRRVPHMKSQRVKIASDKLLLLMKFVKNNPYGVSMQNALLYIQGLVPFVNISIHDLRDQVHELSHLLAMDGNMIYSVQNVSPDNVTHQQPLVNKSLMPQSLNKSPSNSELPPTTQTIYAAGQEDPNWIEDFSDENDFATVNRSAGKCQRREKTSEQLATNLAQHMKHEKPDMFNYSNVKNNNVEINVDDYFATMNSKSNAEMNTAEPLDISEIISDRVKSRLEELLKKHSNGIWCAELPDKFLQEYKVPLNYTRLGFSSVREFTSYLPNIFYMTQSNKTEDFLLYSADKRPVVPKTDPIDITQASYNRAQYDEHNTVQAQCNNDDDAPVPSNVSPTITQRFAPVYAMNYNDNVEKILVTELKRTRKYLEVYIVEVFHPNFFWVHLRENVKRFNKMMDDLFDFYQHNKDEYAIAKVALKKGLNCACVYTGRWHRGIIKSVKPDFRTTVLFYDYGTLKTYAPEDVYYLHKDFSHLPAQAIPCGLYNVKPNVGDRWKKSVIDQFIDKVADTLLAATIITIDPTHNSMMIILSDTSEEEDVNINEWLVQERLAQNGITADVEMASIMRYVVNNLNQMPTYCFAEENLMADNCYKATSTEEKHEVPSVPSGPTLPCCDNHQQQQPVRPPPGFLPLSEQRVPTNASTKGFHNSYSFANVNAKTIFGEAETTNPFLADQFNPNDIYQQMYMSVWDENKKLQIRLFDILYDLLERLQLSFKDQIQLNRILKIVEKVLLELLQKEDRSTVKTSSVSNVTSGTMFSDVGSVHKAPYNLNSETLANQEFNANTFSTSNPFDTNSNDRSRNNGSFSTYSSDSFAFKTNWSQSDELSPRVQIPSPATASPTPSMFLNHTPASTFLSSACQSDENIPLTPLSPVIPTNTSIPNNLEFVDNVNNQFVNMLKDTNPFKFPTNKIKIPETQNERTAHDYDASIASYLSAKNPQNYASKTKTANNHARSNCFTPAGHVNENYTPRIVYESGPVMYNTQKKQADADARQNICSSDLHNAQNTQNAQSLELGQYDKKPTAQPANDFTLHKQHKMALNHKITRDNSQIDESYVTRPSPYYMQDSQPIINGELNYYQQNSNTNNLRPVSSQAWNQIEIPEHWKNLKFQNSVPLLNHIENAAFGTSNTLPRQDWNYDNGRKSMPREMNEVTDSSFKFKDDRDKERPMDIYANFWCNTENGSVQHRSATCNISSFLFQKIDLVKGVTFIFNIEQEGWMLTYEFVETFTNLKLYSRLLATLEAMNIKVVFKEIQRSEYPMQFSQLDRYPLNVPRDSEKRIISINLISLQTALALLHKLRIVSREEIENAFKKNEFLDDSVLPVLWNLIVTYRDMRRSIELCSNYI